MIFQTPSCISDCSSNRCSCSDYSRLSCILFIPSSSVAQASRSRLPVHSAAIYIAVNESIRAIVASKMNSYTAAVYDWLVDNSLAILNPDKSEAAVFESTQRVRSLKDAVAMNVAESPIDLSDNIKSFGIMFHSRLSFGKLVRQQRLQGLLFPHFCIAPFYNINRHCERGCSAL